jgi:hypothetical protein
MCKWWCTPKLLQRLKCESKGENCRRSWGTLPNLQHFGGKSGMLELEDGDYDEWQVGHLFTRTCTNQTSWVVHSWNIFCARTNHRHTQTHKTHHNLNLGETTIFPLIVFFIINYENCTQMSFCLRTPKLGVLKFSKLRLLKFWTPVTSCADLWLRWGLKKNYSLHQELFNDMWQATCTQKIQSDSWLLVVKNQIGTLIPSPSIGHNVCYKYSNGSWEPILDIYVSRAFQWYKEFFNTISFDPWNPSLKI